MRTTKAKSKRKALEKTKGYVPARKISDSSLLTRRTKTKKDKLEKAYRKQMTSVSKNTDVFYLSLYSPKDTRFYQIMCPNFHT